jgi:hypothetical protein
VGMIAPLHDLLSKIRGTYVKRYLEELEALRAEHGAALAVQPLFEGLDEGPPLRYDAVLLAGSKVEMFQIDSASMLQFEPVTLAMNDGSGRQITIAPFCWDGALLVLNAGDDFDWQLLRERFEVWLKRDDGDGSSSDDAVVHFLSEPKPHEEGHVLEVDFGTGPPEGVWELLTTCIECGATGVTLTQ